MSDLIGPDGLEADAVVPQCLDNQYVTNEIFAEMIRRGVDYRDEQIAAARERAFRTEFIRSAVYASQVVIQRAFLKNSEFLYKNYQPGSGHNLNAFAELIRQRAIVPYLYKEASLTDNLQFDTRSEGDAATRALLAEVGDDVRCVRLAVDDAANAEATDSMTTAFGANLIRPHFFNESQRQALAAELFADPEALQEDRAWRTFRQALRGLTDYAYQRGAEIDEGGADRKVVRQDVYRDLFAAGRDAAERNRNVPLGRFKGRTADDPYLLEIKKFVDLVYNVNLPDYLRRYTFTPAGMPSRMALQDDPRTGYSHDQILASVGDAEAMEWIARCFTARTQTAMNLPLLAELSVADVLTVRGFPEWQNFKDTQTAILRDPLRCLDKLEPFEAAFNDFQTALSDWYNRTYHRPKTTQRYANFVTLGISVGGSLVVAGAPHLTNLDTSLAGMAVTAVAAKLPQRVKGYAAKLIVSVYDMGQRRLDADRSYTIELMQTSQELLRDDVLDLLNRLTAKRTASELPAIAGAAADQGIL